MGQQNYKMPYCDRFVWYRITVVVKPNVSCTTATTSPNAVRREPKKRFIYHRTIHLEWNRGPPNSVTRMTIRLRYDLFAVTIPDVEGAILHGPLSDHLRVAMLRECQMCTQQGSFHAELLGDWRANLQPVYSVSLQTTSIIPVVFHRAFSAPRPGQRKTKYIHVTKYERIILVTLNVVFFFT